MMANSADFTIREMVEGDLDELSALAHRIWRQHYTPIIGAEQVEYMLQTGNQPQHYRKILETPEKACRIALQDADIIGFMVSKPAEHEGYLFIQNLYVDAAQRGKGVGRALLDCVSHHPLLLRVNRHNAGSVAFYQRYGFEIIREDVLDIGEGYVMDDYIMQRPISSG